MTSPAMTEPSSTQSLTAQSLSTENTELALASSSRWRRELLDRLQLPYRCHSPDIDETPHNGETPHALVHRLALSKANAVSAHFPHHCIIGSDQVAVFEGDILGKPHTVEKACANLARFSGQRVTFLTGLALLDTRHRRHQVHVEPFEVVFRTLSTQEIENKFSLRASITGALFFDNVRVPAASVLPGVSSLRGPLSCLTQARYGITWGVIGAAQACLDEVLRYTEDRVLFGRPLSHTQSIQIRMADMARRITSAQLLSLHLGRLKDRGELKPAQVSLAKWNNCRAAIDIARDARDILGGSGISAEFVPIRHMLNLESVITYEGTETVHQLVVGKELTGVNAF